MSSLKIHNMVSLESLNDSGAIFLFPALFLSVIFSSMTFRLDTWGERANVFYSDTYLARRWKPLGYPYRASIVVSTYNRLRCLKRVVDIIYNNMPAYTELVIADDHSKGEEYTSYYKQLSAKENIAVYVSDHPRGAFQNKLMGFRKARGEYIMSCDDDDVPDAQYYREMERNIDPNYDIIATKNGVYFKYNENITALDALIPGFHNHVNMAIKKSLIMSIPYPEDISIIRDDAPIVIPLYISTTFDKIKFYNNQHKYKLDRVCRTWHRGKNQMVQYYRQTEVRNGYNFLMNFTTSINKTQYHKLIRQAYRGFIKGTY